VARAAAAAERFACGDTIKEIAHGLRVTEGSVRPWQKGPGGDGWRTLLVFLHPKPSKALTI
jgi:hypothetical protein